MLTVTTRKVGNSISLSIPKQLQIGAGEEYVVYKSQNGGLIFAPKISNPFLSTVPYEDDQNNLWQELAQKELENGV